MFRPSSVCLTRGPVGTGGAPGRAARFSGTSTVAISSPFEVHSKLVTMVASTGRRVIWRESPLSGSAT